MRATCSKGAVAAGRMQNRERVRSIDAREAKQEKKNKRALFFNFLSTCAALAVVKKSSRCWIFIHSRLPAWRNAFKERERRRKGEKEEKGEKGRCFLLSRWFFVFFSFLFFSTSTSSLSPRLSLSLSLVLAVFWKVFVTYCFTESQRRFFLLSELSECSSESGEQGEDERGKKERKRKRSIIRQMPRCFALQHGAHKCGGGTPATAKRR